VIGQGGRVRDGGQRRDDRVLRRTQRTIAVVRAAFAIVVGSAIILVLLNGEHNQNEYDLPGVAVTVRLWQVLTVALLVLAVVCIGAVAEFVRAARRHQFDT
jgi:uncharacterized membrane protein (DUF4010 family)